MDSRRVGLGIGVVVLAAVALFGGWLAWTAFQGVVNPPSDPLYKARFVVAILEAIGVVSAVVLTLWERIQRVLFRPKVLFDFRDPTNPISEEILDAPGAVEGQAIQYCCDLVLQNVSRSPATVCRLVVAECHKEQGGSLVPLARRLRPAQAPWANSRDTIELHHGLPATLRLFTVQEQAQGRAAAHEPPTSGPTQALALLQILLIHSEGTADPLVLGAGTYRLHLGIVADSGVRADVTLRITYEGVWHDRLPRMREALSISKTSP